VVDSNTPTPDPTVLTTEALARAVRAERDYFDSQTEVIGERLRGIDRATSLLNETVNRVPTEVQKEVSHLRELMDERSEAVITQFSLVERQRVEQKSDTKAAVDAALAAAKEAVKEQTTAFGLATAKSETSTLEQLKQLTVTFNTAISGVQVTLGDLKDRINRIEATKAGGKETLTGIYALVGFLVSVLVLLGILVAAGVFKR
jgi:chromosome segregation ATPase